MTDIERSLREQLKQEHSNRFALEQTIEALKKQLYEERRQNIKLSAWRQILIRWLTK